MSIAEIIPKRWIPRILGVAIVAIWVTIGLAASSPADAWVLHNCRYSGTSPAIGYRFHNMEADNETAVTNAQANWDATDAPGYFWSDTRSTDPELDIYDGTYTGGAWAFVDYGTHDCSTSGGNWDNNETDLQIDIGDTSGLSAAELEIVMIHELGHTYGLNHSSFTCTGSGPAVMRQGTGKFGCAGTAPWPNDVAGVHAAY